VLEGMHSVTQNLPADAVKRITFLMNCTSPVAGVDVQALEAEIQSMHDQFGVQLASSDALAL
jgi:hypothetical protein